MHRVLIITYYWPPAGGPGVQRWLKFVKYLPGFGVDPLVYVPKNPSYPILDEDLMVEVPQDVKILKRPIREPHACASILSKKRTKAISSGIIAEKKPSFVEQLLLWARGNLFIPDARRSWVKPSVKFLSGIIAEEGIRTVVTTGPPHSVHLIGLGLKQKHPIQWVADFRDPWTSIGYHEKLRLISSSRRKHKKLEKEVLNRADKLIVTSNTTREEFRCTTTKPIKVITNGYDHDGKNVERDEHFTISHIGSLLTGRNPKNLWKALKELVDENELFKTSLRIQLAGVVGGEVIQSLEEFGLIDLVDQRGYLPHQRIMGLQQKSQVLLLLEIDSEKTKGIIPGKLFEYFRAKRPILAIGPKGWEAAQMVTDTQAGKTFGHHDLDSLKTVLSDWFEQYQKGDLAVKSKGIEKYHRKKLTEDLANYIQWESF